MEGDGPATAASPSGPVLRRAEGDEWLLTSELPRSQIMERAGRNTLWVQGDNDEEMDFGWFDSVFHAGFASGLF